MYWAGEIRNKNFKYFMGVPIAILAALAARSYIPLWCIVTYGLAAEVGYGDDSRLTKLLGKDAAITICGCLLGIASFPHIGWWAVGQGIVSAVCWSIINEFDIAGRIKEPWVAISRAFSALVLILF